MAAKVPTKRIKREIRTLKKGLRAEKKKSTTLKKGIAAVRKRTAKTAKAVAAKTANLRNEMERLRSNIESLAKKKTPKKQLSEYNLFMRRQLKAGKSFAQAVRLWKAYRRGRQVARARLVRKIVTRPGRAITKVRTIVRKVPVIRTRTVIRKVPATRTRAVIRRAPAAGAYFKATGTPSQDFGNGKIMRELHSSLSYIASEIGSGLQEIKKTVRDSAPVGSVAPRHAIAALGDEQVAIELLTVFFQQVHRLGLKRRLELDDVVDSYFDVLTKIRARKANGQAAEHAPVQAPASKELSLHN